MPGEKKKSSSARLRSTIFIYWSRNLKIKERHPDFDNYYKMKINEIIEQIKSKIKKKV